MNLATPVTIRATFSSYFWPEECEHCGAEITDEDRNVLGAYECPECEHVGTNTNPANEPIERHGWVDPRNPWGSLEQESEDRSCEPDSVTLPLMEAAEFLSDFPGGVWDYSESESEQDIRTGEWKSVTAHIIAPKGAEPLIFAIMDALAF